MARHDTDNEKLIHELVPSSREPYLASEARIPVCLESSAGVMWANSTEISLESMTVEFPDVPTFVREVSVYCELPSVRASVEGHAQVIRLTDSTWRLRFTHLTPRSALAIRALTRAERVRRSPSTAGFSAITSAQLSAYAEATAIKAIPEASPPPPRPSVTLSRLRVASALAADPSSKQRNTA